MEDLKSKKHYFMASDSTKYYADTVEWCPFQNLSDVFICGTYQLDEKSSSDGEKQTRQGNAELYKLVSAKNLSSTGFNIKTEDTISTSGILDAKWCPSEINNKIIFALVCSDGKMLVKSINEKATGHYMSDLVNLDLNENCGNMLLSVDWCLQNENSASLISSDTRGFVNYLQIREAELCILNSWQAHSFESWIASFNYLEQNIVYSGGDDCCFKGWDTRTLPSPIFTKKSHSMGVTSISKSKLNSNFLVTGSYDESIILWDTRQMKSSLSCVNVGGGVWRLKWHPSNPHYLLSASMHNGFHVLSLKGDKLTIEISYDCHKSLAYGADWSRITMDSGSKNELTSELDTHNIKNVIGTCSFYDSLLHVWGINF